MVRIIAILVCFWLVGCSRPQTAPPSRDFPTAVRDVRGWVPVGSSDARAFQTLEAHGFHAGIMSGLSPRSNTVWSVQFFYRDGVFFPGSRLTVTVDLYGHRVSALGFRTDPVGWGAK